MKQIHLNRLLLFLTISSITLMTACDEEWNKHYDESTFNLPDETLGEVIQEMPELSIFNKMLVITGYSAKLNASQSFTVWAPNNNALSGIDTTDKQLVLQIVKNHIGRSRFTTSNTGTQSVKLLNGKFMDFVKEGDGYRFDDVPVEQTNVVTANGFIHILDGYATFHPNIWEYIGVTENFDSVKNYLYNQNIIKYIFEQGSEIGFDTLGQPIYDSSNFYIENEALAKIGRIDSEDNLYTAIVPNNDAWVEAYNRIYKYYNFPDDADSTNDNKNRRDELTKWTIVKDMVYNGYIDQPASLNKIESTTGSIYYQPANLFAGTQQEILSNGLLYSTSQMPFIDTASWFKEIRIEAEDIIGRSAIDNNIFIRNNYGTGMEVSSDEYILVDPLATSSSVEFEIPNTLSAKYNIYCVFVPAYIVDKTNLTPSKAKFTLTYISRQTGSTFVRKFTPDNNITNAIGMTKMLVAEYDFEFANIIDEDYDRVAVKLKVENAVTVEEELSGNYSRTMRIDCIILEPVIE